MDIFLLGLLGGVLSRPYFTPISCTLKAMSLQLDCTNMYQWQFHDQTMSPTD